MVRKPTFVLGGKLSPSFVRDVEAGARPSLEFVQFARRNGIDLISADMAPPAPSWMGKVGSKLDHMKMPYARWVAGRAKTFSAIVTSGEDIGIPLAVLMKALGSRTPLLIQVHGHYIEGRKFKLLAPILKRMNSVQMLCLSASLRDLLIHTHGFSPERCHSVGFGVDTRFFSKQPPVAAGVIEPLHPLIVAAGMANRDYPTLFEAVRGLPVRVRIAADSPWETDKAGPDLSGMPDNVEFRSAGTYKGLRDLYGESLCVVVPMHQAVHACGYAVMAEAMAMGRPVIASRLHSPCDFFEDGVHGAYVPPGDTAALRLAIETLVKHPEMAASQGQAGRACMEEAFTLDAFCERIEQYIPG